MSSPIETYLKKIKADLQGGKATEYTYRSALEGLLETLAPYVKAANDPKHIACGAPDFQVIRRKADSSYLTMIGNQTLEQTC